MELTERVEQLAKFVASWKDKPVVWGESDCTAFAAEWVKSQRGERVPFLADYDSREEAHRLIAYYGRLSAIWSQALARIGVFETCSPQLGDVAIVHLADYGEVGVIIGNDRVSILRTDRGARFLRPRSFVKVWSI